MKVPPRRKKKQFVNAIQLKDLLEALFYDAFNIDLQN